ncbi:hypothetical protein [uncultured Clostridium sp.]|uniref:hypothetical protein n=1 Tax=uncultured Clostridium sp. TaxID=59620 RepID=UPI00262838AD|nr:hypothetical protein [uncultured Clostridium sp.]
MLKAAANRGDAIAILDHIDEDPSDMFKNVSKELSVKIVSDNGEDAKKYGAMFTP